MNHPNGARARRGRPLVPLALAATAILALSACEVAEGDNAAAPDAEGDAPGMEHIHGMGINPADDQLYVATHFGLFRTAGGQEPQESPEPERIGGHQHDLMGFTILGPDHFVASGHPAQGDGEHPPNLGVIETTDAGESWEPVALGGEADFHALDTRHDRTYGFDVLSGQLLASENLEDWEQRAGTPMADIAVSPDDPDVLLTTTEGGPELSSDGGREFGGLDDAPLLVFADWPESDRLLGVDVDGTVQASSDGGQSWSEGGSVDGEPVALTTHGDEVYVATHDAIHHSTDDGESFTALHELH